MDQIQNTVLNHVTECIWPTRCAICDKLGHALCFKCKINLHYINPLFCCPRCGAPFGIHQCCFCCTTTMKSLQRKSFPFTTCQSVLHMTHESGHLLSVYKDAGEQSLAQNIALLMTHSLLPEIRTKIQAIVYIPDTSKAYARRGFDHSQLIAQNLSTLLDIPALTVFKRPLSLDQRALARYERVRNMKESMCIDYRKFDLLQTTTDILLIDDVMTTGATILAACEAIQEISHKKIHVLTLIRV